MKIFPESNLYKQTIDEFQEYSSTPLTEQDAFEIQYNLLRLVKLLQEWDRQRGGDDVEPQP